jgi:hypothetical protein
VVCVKGFVAKKDSFGFVWTGSLAVRAESDRTPIDALLQTQLVLGSFGRAGVGGEIAARCGKGDRGREVSIWLKASMRVKG